MMKKWITLILALCMLNMPALASVKAVPNQKLALRTGPNTEYVELYTLPQSTSITAIEYEEGNGVTWVLVEFDYQGNRVCGYTGLKRMSVQGSIPWANHLWMDVAVSATGQVYSAPSSNAAYRGKVDAGESVTLLRYDGDYAYIEFYDAANGAISRGWIPEWMIGGDDCCEDYDHCVSVTSGVSATLNQKMALRTGPNTEYVELYTLPQSASITAIEYEEGNGVTWVLVEFFYQGQRVRGYTGLKRMTVHGDIPWASHPDWGRGYVPTGGNVYAAPNYDAAYRATLPENWPVTMLKYEDEYFYIEYTDPVTGQPSRGYYDGSVISD